MSSARILAVIPSLSAARIPNITVLSRQLHSTGVETVVFANGRSLRDADEIPGVRVLSVGRNVGFGAAVNLSAASVSDWDWLLLVNDDIEFHGSTFGNSLDSAIAEVGAGTSALVYFDDSPAKQIPTVSSIGANLSLVAGIGKRMGNVTGKLSRSPRDSTYRSFSLVAISRGLWDSLGGFDERFPFTFEDSDFVRRAKVAGATFLTRTEVGASHAHSETSRRHIDSVLPVSAWGAFQYLVKWGTQPTIAKVVCIAALLLRVVFVPTVHAPLKPHLKGIGRAIRALHTEVVPSLPPFDTM